MRFNRFFYALLFKYLSTQSFIQCSRMKRRYSILFLPVYLLIDFIVLNGAFLVSYYLRFGVGDGVLPFEYWTLQLIGNLVWFVVVGLGRPYNYSRVQFHVFSLAEQYAILTGIHASVIAFCWILLKEQNLSRLQLFYFYAIFFAAGVFWRTLAVVILKIYRATGHNTRRYVVVGYGKLSIAIKRFYENHPEMGFQFYGFFDELTADNRHFLRGDLERAEALLATGKIDCVYCCAPYLQSEVLNRLVEKSPKNDFQVKLVIDFAGFLGRRSAIEYHDMMPIVSLSNQMWEDVKVKWLKRCFDVGFSFAVLIFGFPVWLMVALITKFTSKGPIFYSQERIGRQGIPFKIYKFRSMKVDAEKNGPTLSLGKDDLRVTRWGQFIRQTRLDEIPQFYNVLRGDMSVVGPRPERKHFIDLIMEISPEYKNLLQLKPGITSIGQIRYGYAQNVEEMTKRLRYDIIYLKRISLFFDVWLIMQTVLVMVKGKGK